MNVIFVVFNSLLSRSELAPRRKQLAELLGKQGHELCVWHSGTDGNSLVPRLVMEAKALPVVALDDASPLPDKAPWLADLTRDVINLQPLGRPQVVYVTQRASGAGNAQALRHAVVRHYVKRDDRARWVEDVADAVLNLIEQLRAATATASPPPTLAGPEIVGASPCFLAVVEQLDHVLRSPYGLVTGDSGVGKMYLIRAMWRQQTGKKRVFVLPCGSFFKDYYVAGRRRVIGGGRESVNELGEFLKQADHGLLVLHQVERLPMALQEELAVRLSDSSGGPPGFPRWLGVGAEGLIEYDVKILATSAYSPDELELKGRVLPELLTKLRKRHVRIPTLRQRGPEDLQLLCEDIVKRVSTRQELPVPPRIEADALGVLQRASWPGNLSDLVRVLEHAVWQSRGGAICARHLPEGLAASWKGKGYPTLAETLAQAQRTAIVNALEHCAGDVVEAAKLLGVHKGTIYRLMEKQGIDGKRRG